MLTAVKPMNEALYHVLWLMLKDRVHLSALCHWIQVSKAMHSISLNVFTLSNMLEFISLVWICWDREYSKEHNSAGFNRGTFVNNVWTYSLAVCGTLLAKFMWICRWNHLFLIWWHGKVGSCLPPWILCSEKDTVYLEDESGRVKLFGKGLEGNSLVTGVVADF
jgi:hypothetical protein